MTRKPMTKRLSIAMAIAAALGSACPRAVTLNPDNTGQALIFPYYTARGSFNTYLSVVNHTRDAKALRVNVREARFAKPVASFNLFLAPNDAWTAAVVPSGEGASLVSRDYSCTDPAPLVAPPDQSLRVFQFHDRGFTGGQADGAGTGLERTREGYVELLEMATLTGAAAEAVAHLSIGLPRNCALVQSPPSGELAAPKGGLSGTLTLIDVARGMDFTVNAEALADLASAPYYRRPDDPYPALNAAEIDPVSVITANGKVYRSVWPRGLDAVSAVMMRRPILEYSLDNTTRSATDIVVTMPTRHLHADATAASAPFRRPAQWLPNCGVELGEQYGTDVGEKMGAIFFNREERGAISSGSCFHACAQNPVLCANVSVGSVQNAAAHLPAAGPTHVLAAAGEGFGAETPGRLPVNSSFTGGWITLMTGSSPIPRLTSLPASTSVDLATGQVEQGSHTVDGLPLVGFTARIFRNGTLECGSAACQGNFGGAFPFRYTRSISP